MQIPKPPSEKAESVKQEEVPAEELAESAKQDELLEEVE